jgi:chromosome partitioning protein
MERNMGKIITVSSHKGGVGKTTTVLNLGYSLSRLGQKVLLVDADPQGGMTIASNLKKQTTLGLVDLQRDPSKAASIIMPTRDQTMALVGTGISEPKDVFFFEKEVRKGNLGKSIRSMAGMYDYAFIDAPAGIGSVVTMLLAISDSVLIPMNCRTLAVKTFPSFLRLIQNVKGKINSDLRLEGVLMTMMDHKNPSELKVGEEVRSAFPQAVFFETIIPFDDYFEKSNASALPVAFLPEAKEATRSYMDLALELKIRETQDSARGESDEQVEGLF